jgi:hypothetical protein
MKHVDPTISPAGLGLAFALALALAAAPASLLAAEAGTIPRFSVEIDGGAVFVSQHGFGPAGRLGTGVVFRTGHRMGTEILVDRYKSDMAPGAAGLPVAGRMTMPTLIPNERLYVLTKGRILPYALMGFGFAFPRYAPESWPAGTPRRVFVDRMALQVGAGADIRLARSLGLCLKARYNLVKTWMEDQGRTTPIRDVDPLAQDMLHLYGLELGLGLKICL